MTVPDTYDEDVWTDVWYSANNDGGCQCHTRPPCNFCVMGYSLELDDYLATIKESYVKEPKASHTRDPAAAYDNAMKGLF